MFLKTPTVLILGTRDFIDLVIKNKLSKIADTVESMMQ